MIRERFAPSPTGFLHLGHAYSALLAWDNANLNDGKFLLRIEDIDTPRCKLEFEQAIYQDLEWLGIKWEKPVLRQSNRQKAYKKIIQKLWDDNILFACTCTRKDIQIASAPQEGGATILGPDGIVYPGTCHPNGVNLKNNSIPPNHALRLSMSNVLSHFSKSNTDGPMFTFTESGSGPKGETGEIAITAKELQTSIGDIIIARKDIGISYHLAVVLDDAYQNITHITRGEDLFEATKIHVVLQKLLGLPTPIYHHHKLIRDENGNRLAKRYDAMAIRKYRADGVSPQDIRKMVGL